MCRHVIKVATLLLVAVFCAPNLVESAPLSEQVTIHALSCHPLSSSHDVLVEAYAHQGQVPETPTVSVRLERSNLYAIGFRLKPGDYRIGMTTTGCADVFDLTILPGHERQLASYMYKGGLEYHDHGSISGSLPFSGLNIFARCDADKEGTRDISAVIDGTAYYFNNLPDCRYSLLVSFAFSSIEVKLPKDVDIVRSSAHAVVNISVADIDAAGKAGLPFGTRL